MAAQQPVMAPQSRGQVEPPVNANYSMKDYSKDANVNGWAGKNQFGQVEQMGGVALQAQGYSVPARLPPPVKQFPHGLSIIQDP